MATTKVQLPSGEAVRVQHKEGASEQDILQYAFEQYVINDAANTAIGRGIAQGIDNLQKAYGSSVEGIGSFLDSESLKQIGADIVTQQEADIAARQFRTQRDIPQDVGTFTEGMRYVETLAGESAPQMATTLAGAAAGAAAGSVVMPVVGTAVGAFVGGFLSNVPYFYGSNRERQKEAIEQGIKTEVDEGAAALAAIPQSALDAIIGALGAKFLATPAMKAGGGVFTRAAKGSAVGSVTEAPTEIGQAVLERYQAGLSLTNNEAMVEYAQAGVGGAVLGGLLGGGGAVMSRTPAGTEQQRKEVVGKKKPFAVRYERTTKDGATSEVNEIIYADSLEDAQQQANELLSKDNAVLNQTLTVTSAPGSVEIEPSQETEPEPVAEDGVSVEESDYILPEIEEGAATTRLDVGLLSDEQLQAIIDSYNESSRDGSRVRSLDYLQELDERLEREALKEAQEQGTQITDAEIEERVQRVRKKYDRQRKRIARAIKERDARRRGEVSQLTEAEFDAIAEEDQRKRGRKRGRVPAPEPTPEPAPEPVTEFEFTKSEGKPDPKYIGGAVVEYANDFSRAVRISPKSKVFKSVRARLKKQYNLTDSQLDDLRKKANRKLLEQKRAGRPLSLDMTTELPSLAPVPTPTPTEQPLIQEGMDQDEPILYSQRTEPTVGARRVIPELRERALPLFNKVKAQEEVTAEESRELAAVADKYKPATRRSVPEPETTERMQAAHQERKAKGVPKRDLVGVIPSRVDEGQEVAGRLDIPSYEGPLKVWTATLHEPASSNPREFSAGDVIGYDSVMYLTDVTFGIGSEKRGLLQNLAITKGGGKGTIATMRGKYKKVSPQEAKQLADQFNDDPAWTQVGMDPERRNYFYNRDQDSPDFMREVIASDEVIQVGPVVLAKNVQYGPTPKNEFISRLAYEIQGEPTEGPLTDEQIEDGVEGPQGVVAETDISGKALSETPVVGASQPVNIEGAKKIRRKEMDRRKGFVYFSDRTRFGTYTGLDPESGISIPLQGGPGYPFARNNKKASAGWAFTDEGMFTRFLNKVKRVGGVGFIALYAKNNLRANGTFLRAYVAEIKHAIKTGKISEARFLEVANELRKAALETKTLKLDSPARPLFEKPFKSVSDFDNALAASSFEVRSNLFFQTSKNVKGETTGSKISTAKLVNEGFPDIVRMIDLFVDPDLADRPRGQIVGAVEFDTNQVNSSTAQSIGTDEHLSYPVVIRGRGIGVFSDPVSVLDVFDTQKKEAQALRSAEVSMPEVVVGAAQQPTPGQNAQLGDAVTSAETLAEKIGAKVQARDDISRDAQYNYETRTIEYNPELLARRGPEGAKAAMREEIIHATMHKVLMDRSKGKTPRKAFEDFFNSVGKSMTPEQRALMQEAYGATLDDTGNGAEYTRFLVQSILDGRTTEETMTTGPAFNKVKALIKSVQNYATRIFGKDMEQNREAAFVIADTIKLLRSFDPNARPANQKIVSDALAMASGLDAMSSENISDPSIGTYEERTRKQQLSRIKRSIARVIQPASEFFNSINPRITQELRKYLTGMEEDQFRAAGMVQDFQKGISGIKNEQDRNELARLLSYSPDPQSITEGEHKDNIRRRDELLLKYDLYNKYKLQVRPLLDQLYQQAIDAGLDVNYLQEYFPRRIKDFVGLMNLYGKDVNEDFLDYVEQENKRRSESGEKLLIPSDYPTEFDNYLNQKKFVQPSRIPANLKERRTNMISKEAQSFYYEPEVALSAYLNNIIEAIATQNLVGNATRTKKQPVVVDGQTVLALNLNDPTGSLNRVVGELVANGEITKGQMQSLEYGLVQFLQPKNASEGDLFKLSRTFGYGTLLVEVTSTLSQMYDMAFIMLDNGILPSLGAMVGRKSVRMRDLGFDPDRLSAEYPMGGKGKTKFFNDLVKTGLTVTGFRRMDQLMKETNLTANYRRFQRLAKLAPNSNKHQKFRKEVEFLVGSDVDNVINDLKLNKPDSPFIRNLLTNKILETQPLNRLELPLLANDNANGRALYLMKSFMVKQMGLIWRRQISVMINRDLPFKQRSAAAREVVKLLLLFILVGLPVDFFKDLLAGRDVYPDDYVTNALLRVAGMSKYTIYQAKREGLGGAARAYFMPVGIDQTLNMATDIGNVLMDPSSIPDTKAVSYLPFSDWWYYRYGPGVEKQERQRTRKRKEGIRPGEFKLLQELGL